MMKKTALVAFSLVIAASTATAQQPSTKELMQQERDYMTFSFDDAPASESYTTWHGCTAYKRPNVPKKLLHFVGSGRLLEYIYVHQVADSIKKAGKCTCALRFPKWDATLAEYWARFEPLKNDDSSAWVSKYVQEAPRIDNETRITCRNAGVQ